MREELVAADVQGADGHHPGGQGLHHLLIILEKLLFRGQVALAQVKELGAVQPHAVGPVLGGQGSFFRHLDIGHDPGGQAVAGGGGHGAAQDHLRLEDLEIRPPGLVDAAQRIVRVQDHHAGDAVQDNQVPGLDLQGGAIQSDHRRNLQGMGDDGGMGGLAAPLGDEAQHLGLGHLGGFRRGQVPGHYDDRLLERKGLPESWPVRRPMTRR